MNQSTSSNPKFKPENRKKIPRRITQGYLHNAGLYYLQRFSASSQQFREVMQRKVLRSCAHHKDQNKQTCMALVETLVQKFLQSGLLNDESYARGLVESLRRRGKSSRVITNILKTKGFDQALALTFLQDHAQTSGGDLSSADLTAALAYVRKKKLGAFRGDKPASPQKDLASMARAGFSYEISRRVLDFEESIDINYDA